MFTAKHVLIRAITADGDLYNERDQFAVTRQTLSNISSLKIRARFDNVTLFDDVESEGTGV